MGMKRNWILIPSLIAASSLPAISLVGCGNQTIMVNEWDGEHSCIESQNMELIDGNSYNFAIDLNAWGMAKDIDFYHYFSLYLSNGSPAAWAWKIKENSLKIAIDGKELSQDDWEYNDGICFFRKEEIIQQILDSKQITGSFMVQGPEQGASSFGGIWFYGDWNLRPLELKMLVPSFDPQPMPSTIKLSEPITVGAYDKHGKLVDIARFFSHSANVVISGGTTIGTYTITGVNVCDQAEIVCLASLYVQINWNLKVVE